MHEISILKVENPSCMWGRLVKCQDIEAALNKNEYVDLQVKMNLFYHDVNLDMQKVKPSSVEQGQVCVVYSSALRSWCRVIVEALFKGSAGTQAMCFLVDHAERVVVAYEEILAPLDRFLQLPFWVRKYKLAGILPMTLQVSGDCLEKAELITSTQWDSSATRYLHNLLRASTQIEAVLCETQPDCSSIELYLTVKNVKICVNDELVSKRFALFKSQKTQGTNGNVDRSVAVLACDIFSETQNFLATDGCTKGSLSDFFPSSKRDPIIGTTVTDHHQMGPSREEASVGFSQSKESQENENKPSEGDKKAGQNLKSKTPLEMDANEEGSVKDAEDTNTSLASDLLQDLNLFRLMKFLNPTSNTQMAVIPNTNINEDERGAGQQIPGITDEEPVTAAHQIERQTETTVCAPSGLVDDGTHKCIFTEQPTTAENLACARLLQFLNPDPLNQNKDFSETVCRDPSRTGMLVHSAMTLDPCTSLANAPITDTFRRILMRKRYSGPSLVESYCWPAVARGCDALIISHSGDKPLSYMPPFLAHMQLSSVFNAPSSHTGPIAVILCPGWEKAQTVFDLLEESQTTQDLHPMLILVGLGKDEAKNVKIQNNCLIIVSTPFTLVRLLGFHCFQFLRLCHLVLDEVDVLFSRAPDEMAIILQHLRKVAAGKEMASCARQIVAAGTRWSPHLEGLLRDHMTYPSVVVTVAAEAALYGNVHQRILLCLDSTKISVLLAGLDLTLDVAQKTLVITNSAEEVEQVFKAISNTSAFTLKAHEGLTYQFDFVIEQWKKPIGPGTHVILVTNNECIKALGIRDATCVVHYSFPNSRKLFGSRLFCMSDNFRNLSDERTATDGQEHQAKSLLLLSEKNTSHVIGVLRYLKRTEALLPAELLHFAQGVLQAKEAQKTDRPFCLYLKSFGFCRDTSVCPDRHTVSRILDQSLHPESGTIVVQPMYIKTASVYYGRIVSKEDPYESLAAEMTAYYATGKLGASEVIEGGFYGVQEDMVYHRVRVTSVPDKGDRLFSSVRALFVDEGREQEVKSHQLLQLPAQFHLLPPQAREIVVCRAMPIDAEVDWNPKVIRAISQKIKGLQHQAKVVMSLGNTVFVDPMVRMTHLPGLKTSINEYNVHTEILRTGMGTSNPQHLDRLKELCQKAGPLASAGLEDSEVSLEDKAQAAKQALVHRMRAAVDDLHNGSGEPPQKQTVLLHPVKAVSLLHVDPKLSGYSPQPPMNQVFVNKSQPLPKPQVPGTVVSELSQAQLPALIAWDQIPDPLPTHNEAQIPALTPKDIGPTAEQWRSLLTNMHGSTQQPRCSALQGPSQRDWISALHHPVANGDLIDNEPISGQKVISNENANSVDRIKVDAPKRFHPQITWFQRDDTVILNIKLREPVKQTCEFFPDRVVYSARVGDRPYHADLELHSNISVDKCSWEMKCNEPVIRLVKGERGSWKRLLNQKSAFVSLDFNHFEDEAKKISNDHCVVGHAGMEGCYYTSESDSDSD